ncbi:MAG: efflux RND transporter periplasmic adaptor subunit [Mangrovibacterium sp.]|nr:efflux RND transporter periplasmic adaptor subunit [Mangrovibacterium sp.]
MKTSKQFRNLMLVLSLSAAFSCARKQDNGATGTAGQLREYQVMEVKKDSITLYKDYPTTLEGQQTVEIRAKIAGYIDDILVDEGDMVRKGQVLFRINANDILATVRSAEALVKVAEAEVETARINLEKTKPLAEKEIVSPFNLKSAEVALLARKAQLAQAKANLANAKANLQYAVITSPADGIIGNFPYRVGSLVSSGSVQPLTSISNTEKMFAYFSMNEKEFLSLTRGLEGPTLQGKLAALPAVQFILADNTVHETAGRIETASGLVDIQTGSVNLRATFPNPSGTLRSGSSGTVRLPQRLEDAIIIPQKAAYELQGKHFVYVVGEENKVRNTEITVLTGNLKDSYVVTGGLKPGDQIVIEGIAGLRNDMPIKPRQTTAQSSAANTGTPANN